MTDQSTISAKPRGGLVILSSPPSLAPPFICFHHAGGSAQTFRSWRDACASRYTLMALELPGRGRRLGEPFVRSIREAAAHFARDLAQLELGDAVFFGHSLGAMLAYETVRVLQEAGRVAPIRLVVSSRSAPGSSQWLASLPNLSDHALMRYLAALDGTPNSVLQNTALMKVALPILRADLQLIYGYEFHPAPRLSIPVDVIGAIEDHSAPIECLMEWRSVTTGSFGLRMIPGGHFAPVHTPAAIVELVGRPH